MEVGHLGVVLLDDGHRHGVLFAMAVNSVTLCHPLLDATQVFQLQQSPVVVDIDIRHIVLGKQLRIEMNVIAIQSVHHAECLQCDVVPLDGRFYIVGCQPQGLQLVIVGQAGNLSAHRTADVHHRRLWQLLNALAHHTFGKPSQLGKSQVVRFVLEPHIQIEGRNVHGAGLDHLGALHVLGHRVHGAVYLFVHLDKQQVDVTTRFKGHYHITRIHS